jgi:hypothetical protein
VAAHDAEADDAGAKVGHEPAPATALTTDTILSS